MEKEKIIEILNEFKKGEKDIDYVIDRLKVLPFEDIDFAKIDHHRTLRNGFPEVIYCSGKTIEQTISIFNKIRENADNILLTKASKELYSALKKNEPGVIYHEVAGCITLERRPKSRTGEVLIVAAGTADIPVAEEAAITASICGCNVEKIYDVGVAGLPRLLAFKEKIFGAKCIIAIAGMDGACVPVTAGLASCPVIAVPTSTGYGANFNGIAPLLTMLNSCAPGVGVVNIDNGFGAGYLAGLIVRQKER